MASLAHPDIVATYDTGEDDGVAYFVMELVDGPNLRALLDERGQLERRRGRPRSRAGVTAALDHAHRNGIVHRDIKPANVLVPDARPGEGHRLRDREGRGRGRPHPRPARSSAPRATSRPSRSRRRPSTRAPTSTRSVCCSTRCSPGTPRSRATPTWRPRSRAAHGRAATVAQPLRPDVPLALEAITTRCLALDPDEPLPGRARRCSSRSTSSSDDDSDARRGRGAHRRAIARAAQRVRRHRHPPAARAPRHGARRSRGDAQVVVAMGDRRGALPRARARSPASSWSSAARDGGDQRERAPPASAHRSSVPPTSTPTATRPSTPRPPTRRSTATPPPRGRRERYDSADVRGLEVGRRAPARPRPAGRRVRASRSTRRKAGGAPRSTSPTRPPTASTGWGSPSGPSRTPTASASIDARRHRRPARRCSCGSRSSRRRDGSRSTRCALPEPRRACADDRDLALRRRRPATAHALEIAPRPPRRPGPRGVPPDRRRPRGRARRDPGGADRDLARDRALRRPLGVLHLGVPRRDERRARRAAAPQAPARARRTTRCPSPPSAAATTRSTPGSTSTPRSRGCPRSSGSPSCSATSPTSTTRRSPPCSTSRSGP